MFIYTIGFTQKSAQDFFNLLQKHKIQHLVDIRLRPSGQLSGFAKGEDLAWFLKNLIDCHYSHMPDLAPTATILDQYREDHNWEHYVRNFELLMDERKIPYNLLRETFNDMKTCLLCSEAKPAQCHRRLVVERLQRLWIDLEIIHL